jgi:hypothetical protein
VRDTTYETELLKPAFYSWISYQLLKLRKHDSSNVFRKLGDAIYTNDTGINLMALLIVYVGSDEPSKI